MSPNRAVRKGGPFFLFRGTCEKTCKSDATGANFVGSETDI